MTTLRARDLHAGYGDLAVLHGATVELVGGRLTTIVGSNGSGKTTLLRTLTGLIPATSGDVELDGRPLGRLRAHERARLGIVLVPEGRQLFSDMTVLENLEMGATGPRGRASMSSTLDEVYALFPRVAERRRQVAGTLSGGEQQMVAVARGLMAKPSVLILDEPSLGLSPKVVLDLFEIVARLRGTGLTMCLVEQNVRLALAIADDAYVLRHGRVEIAGPAHVVRDMPEVQAAYLGG